MQADLPNEHIVGAAITDAADREQWRALVKTLHAAASPGGPLASWVFHGTSLERARSILEQGMNATDVLLRDGPIDSNGEPFQRWTAGTYWATPCVSAFYAEDKIEQHDDPTIPLGIVAARLEDVMSEGIMEVDEQTLDASLDTRLGRDTGQLFAEWDASEKGWQDCLRIFGSAVCLSPVGAEHLRMIATLDDLDALIQDISGTFGLCR